MSNKKLGAFQELETAKNVLNGFVGDITPTFTDEGDAIALNNERTWGLTAAYMVEQLCNVAAIGPTSSKSANKVVESAISYLRYIELMIKEYKTNK